MLTTGVRIQAMYMLLTPMTILNVLGPLKKKIAIHANHIIIHKREREKTT